MTSLKADGNTAFVNPKASEEAGKMSPPQQIDASLGIRPVNDAMPHFKRMLERAL